MPGLMLSACCCGCGCVAADLASTYTITVSFLGYNSDTDAYDIPCTLTFLATQTSGELGPLCAWDSVTIDNPDAPRCGTSPYDAGVSAFLGRAYNPFFPSPAPDCFWGVGMRDPGGATLQAYKFTGTSPVGTYTPYMSATLISVVVS